MVDARPWLAILLLVVGLAAAPMASATFPCKMTITWNKVTIQEDNGEAGDQQWTFRTKYHGTVTSGEPPRGIRGDPATLIAGDDAGWIKYPADQAYSTVSSSATLPLDVNVNYVVYPTTGVAANGGAVQLTLRSHAKEVDAFTNDEAETKLEETRTCLAGTSTFVNVEPSNAGGSLLQGPVRVTFNYTIAFSN